MAIRLPESGSKIACKYISNPVLLKIPEIAGGGVKFDVRYILLVRSLRPLKLYVHRIFWLRFANRPYSLKELDDYQTHLTVINYRANNHIREMDYETFLQLYHEQYQQHPWSEIETKIFQMFRELFHCATMKEPPLGIGSCSASRALYAADLILESTDNNGIQPKLLEVNFTPDCSRASTYYPNFYNQIFNALYRDLIDTQDILDISN